MKTFDEQIKNLRGQFSSISQISSDSNSLFADKYGPLGKGGSTIFDGTYLPGKIYQGEYYTKTRVSDKHPYINRNPLFFFIKQEKTKNGDILVSLDLNVIPPDYRGNIFFKLWNQYGSILGDNDKNPQTSQIPIPNLSASFKSLLRGTGWQNSLTGFKKDFMKNVKVVDYADWVRIPYLSDTSIEGQGVSEIYNSYRSKLNP